MTDTSDTREPKGSVTLEHRPLVEALLSTRGAMAVQRVLSVSGINYSYPALDRVRRDMERGGIRPPLRVAVAHEPLHAPPDYTAARYSSEALHEATLKMFRRTAERDGITLAEAGVRALYGQAAFERWRAQA